jgi:alkylated DNA repair dioxygenase AlkB
MINASSSSKRKVARQTGLFQESPKFPEGFLYQPDLIDAGEEGRLVAEMENLDFAPFEFQGFLGKREIVSFGWRYDFNGGGLQQTDDIPSFLTRVREQAAAFAGLAPSRLQQVLLTKYPPGSTIGWHKDRPIFDDVIGISLQSACTFRFRQRKEGGWERRSFTAEPRSIYLLRGPSRWEWEHSIPAVATGRYSITFRSFREK